MTFGSAPRRTPRKLALWTHSRKTPQKKQPHRISPISHKRAERLKLYKRLVKDLAIEFTTCQATGCTAKGQELHHTRGRTGTLLTDRRFIKRLCQKCHEKVHREPAWARTVGLLCDIGQWNTIPR